MLAVSNGASIWCHAQSSRPSGGGGGGGGGEYVSVCQGLGAEDTDVTTTE